MIYNTFVNFFGGFMVLANNSENSIGRKISVEGSIARAAAQASGDVSEQIHHYPSNGYYIVDGVVFWSRGEAVAAREGARDN